MDNSLGWDTVEIDLKTQFGRVQVAHGLWDRPIDQSTTMPNHHLELSLLSRIEGGPLACYVDSWGPNRFEPVGHVFFLPAAQRIHFRSQCPQQNSVICEFDPIALANWLELDMKWEDCALKGLLNIANSRIRSLLFHILREARHPGFASETMIELNASQIAIELSRHRKGIEEGGASKGLAVWRLRLIDQRLAEDNSPPTLSELATLCNLSARHLAREFRISRGVSVGSYIAEVRAKRAKQLIASGMSIKAVAYTMGFSAPSNFTAAFIRLNGESPRQYKQRVNGSTNSASRA